MSLGRETTSTNLSIPQPPGWWRNDGGADLFVSDRATVGATGWAGETEAGVHAVENHGIRLHFPSLFLQGLFHRFLVIPKEDLRSTDQADDFVGFFGAIQKKGDVAPWLGLGTGFLCFFLGGRGTGRGLGRGFIRGEGGEEENEREQSA